MHTYIKGALNSRSLNILGTCTVAAWRKLYKSFQFARKLLANEHSLATVESQAVKRLKAFDHWSAIVEPLNALNVR